MALKTLKPMIVNGSAKQERERRVLLALVEHYIETGKPVGSLSLKESGQGDLSSATIRNYFAHLEEEGYLTQTHTSSGRIPTSLAFRTYAEHFLHNDPVQLTGNPFSKLKAVDSREMSLYLQEAAEQLSALCHCAVFLSAPRFDRDFARAIKLVPLDTARCLSILVTDFGVVKTEMVYLPEYITPSAIKRLENYFQWRLTGAGEKQRLSSEEEAFGQEIYNELMLRFVVGYHHFTHEELYRTGFSHLLTYSDFEETSQLIGGLSLFENVHGMRLLLRECTTLGHLKFWIGEDLDPITAHSNCSAIAIPYSIHHKCVGAIGLLGPIRLPYRTLFATLRLFADTISETITKNVYKYKLTYREADEKGALAHADTKRAKIKTREPILLT